MFNWLKKNKKYSYYNLPNIEEVLDDEQIGRAFLFYKKNKEYINKLMKQSNIMAEPSQSEDKNKPILWKAEYWNWFFYK